MNADRSDRELTTTLHLAVRGVVSDSPSQKSLESLELLTSEEREVIANLNRDDAMLLVHRGARKGSRFLLNLTDSTIGRAPESDIFLDDVTVSRVHAKISQSSSKEFTLVDSGSLNGTYVNNVSITNLVLSNGDEVQIGKFHMLFLRGEK
ncbi:MAG: FHA domain-containing protein [Actinobacteria bacterium]|uniref:Unannotated protein n=1 Tax=freshwater metagenome TaxID=449393 RepID=A0A6J7TSG0_9ZZZZ|nr:FHA domain-containing protein [Actinomycetota bacterium]MSX25436.1 FHA domain-containing protein [Actinomycetota bacterium]MSY46739.1 FHA domain-containing protein [Actinomycetota bacterium]MTB00253.1 FHA domain-containing protein [Actinomycetota bacterium]